MARKTIAIDMDNVIADTEGHFLTWYEKHYGIKLDPESIKGLSEAEAFPDNAARKFVFTPTFFRTIPVKPGAPEALQELTKYFDIYIVSSAMEFPNSLVEKYEWLTEHFPFISWKNIIFCGDKSVIGVDFMIDDHVRNLEGCKGKTYLFSAGHNFHVNNYTRVSDWKEIVELLKSEVA